MVKTAEIYICEVCDKEGKNRAEMEQHEKTPLRGLEVQVGGIFGVKHDRYPFCFVVVDGKYPTESHEVEYSGLLYQIPSGILDRPFIGPIEFTSADRLSELADREFEKAKEIVEKEGTPQRRGIKQLSKGVLKEI